ncbi:replication protein [Cronobacter dublinensis]|nr:replication protein [Cronobacter dublinensis]ELY3972323.1 replication protein [Cronobacter dublinensis]ELY4483543.1 replication protein [Cronobacter dublinensis]ELY5822753.1 replication protein [Cronobacter dublinensis]
MSSNVQKVDFSNRKIIPDKPGGHVADLENGYLRLANQIQDALCKVELSGREFRVLNSIIRLTYGWSKKEDRITNSLIADTTELSVKHSSEAVNNLAERRILKLRRIGQTRYIGINTDLNEWAYKKPASEVNIPKKRDAKTIPGIRDSHPRNQGSPSPKSGNTKDIITNTNKQPPKSPKGESSRFDPLSIPVPEWLNQDAWFEWVKYRQDSKKPIKTEITVTKAFGVLKDCFDCGYDPAEIINSSIANGYQGLFKPKFPVRKQLPLAQPQPEQHWNSRESWENEFL